jgi:hypothetical protein
VVSAVAQLPYGIEQVTTSRYRYVVLLLLLPGLALLMDFLVTAVATHITGPQRRPAFAAAGVVLCLLGLHAAMGQYGSAMGWRTSVNSPAATSPG